MRNANLLSYQCYYYDQANKHYLDALLSLGC